jgi:diguanylate cyclase (GGDEF)-like protein
LSAVLPPSAADAESSVAQAFDRMMVRVLGPLFMAGAAAVALLWWIEVSDGKLSAANSYAYPLMLALFGTGVVVLRTHPRFVRGVRWVGFLAVALSQLGDLAGSLLQSGPLIGNYDAVTLFIWLPLIYALAFFMLDGRGAVISACVVLLLIAAGFTWRVASPGDHSADISLLINVLASHAVFIFCLTGWLRMKQLLSNQHGVAERLRVLAATDPLTGLFNRRQALDALGALGSPAAGRPAPVALLCDIDHFKCVNDQLGHDVGDRVLVEVAEALRRATRASDIVARWGGEEFLVVLPGTNLHEARELAERLRQRVHAVTAQGAAAGLGGATLSVGVAMHRGDEAVAAWLRRADEALYRAKNAGRDRCELG